MSLKAAGWSESLSLWCYRLRVVLNSQVKVLRTHSKTTQL